jgi:hypothetical protein
VKQYLQLMLPNDAFLELQGNVRECNVPVKELIIGMLEDYLEGSKRMAKSVRSAGQPPLSGSWPKRT